MPHDGSIAPFVVSSPFHGLRVVPCKLTLSDTSNTETPKKEKKTYTVEEIAEQLCVSKKVAYALVKSGQFAYVRAGRAIRVSKDSFDKWLNQN